MHSGDEDDHDLNKETDSPLHELHRSFKRSMSIEGSPMITSSKKIDLNRTPHGSFKEIFPFHIDNGLQTIEELQNFTPLTGDKVLIISSDSEMYSHITGINHQENAYRTALLTGAEGCLRRKELENNVCFINAELVKEAPLADILRYFLHCLNVYQKFLGFMSTLMLSIWRISVLNRLR